MAILSRLDILLHADTAQATQDIRQFGNDANSAFASIRQNAIDMGGKIKAGIGAASAAIGGASTAMAFLVKDQIELANQLTKTAQIANTSAANIQKYTVAAKAMGIEQDKLGDIFKDTQDKVGDFLSTGGGELQDFFNNVAPKIGMTADELRKMSGPDALQAIYNGLEKANLSQSEMIFYMESIADEASLLIPLLQNGGEGFKLWATAAENAGAVMDEKTIRATQELNTTTELLNLSVQGAKNQIAQAFLPVLSDLASELVKDATLKKQAAESGQWLAKGFKVIAMTGVGVVAIVTSIGKAIGGVMAAFAQFGKVTEGVDLSSPFAMFQIGKNVLWDIPSAQLTILKDMAVDVGSSLINADKTMEKINNLGNGATTNPLVSQITTTTNAVQGLKKAYGETGAQIQANKKAAEEAAKAQEKAAKAQAKSVRQMIAAGNTIAVTGDTGIGRAHVDIRYAEGDARRGTEMRAEHLARFMADGRPLTSYTKTSGFGYRNISVKGASKYHLGNDYATPVGTKITTTMPVVSVTTSQSEKGGYISTVTFADGVKINLLHLHPSSAQLAKSMVKTAKQTTSAKNVARNALPINNTVLAHAKQYNYAALEKEYGLPSGILSAISMQESKGNPNVTSPKGAKGEFQFMPATAARFGIKGEERNTAKAAVAAAQYLQYLLNTFGSVDKAIMAYNAGEGNVKNGKANKFKETQGYLKNVKSYLAYMQGGDDGSYNIGDAIAREADEAQRLAEQQANARLSIEREYAGKVRQVELKLAEDIKKIKEANFSATDEAKYIEAAKTRADIEIREYKAAQAEKINSLKDYQQSEEQKIRDKWQRERDAITNNAEYQLAENAAIKEQLLKAIDDKEQYELSQYRITQSQKLSAMTDFNKSELQQIKDRYAYEQLLLQQQPASDDRDIEMAVNQAKQAKEIADLQKQHRDSAVSLYDSLTGNSELTQLKTDLESRKKLLEDAYKNEAITQAEYNAMKLESERAYYEQHRQLRTAQMEAVAGNMTQIMGDLVGKQSKAYRIMFAIEKGFAIARSVMAIQTGIAQAAALPFPANIPAMMSVAAATASIISNIQAVRQPQIDGQAHDGLSYIPREGTYLLDKGERVIKPRDNQRLTQFLDSQPKQLNSNNPALNVQIHNNAPVDVTTRQGENGELIMMIEERVRQSWQRAGGNPNSHEAKMLKRGFNVRPNRG